MPDPQYVALINGAMRKSAQKPSFRVFINNRTVRRVITVHTEAGYADSGVQAPTASFMVNDEIAPFWQTNDEIVIHMGYSNTLIEVFRGNIETVERKYAPRGYQTTAAGSSKKLLRPHGNTAPQLLDPNSPSAGIAFSYNNQTDSQMWNDLCRRAGVAHYDAGDGDGVTYATTRPYNVATGSKLGDIIGKLDESSDKGQRSFEVAGVVVRRPVLGVPSQNPVYHYAQGVQGFTAPYLPIIDVSRNVSDTSIQNQSVVKFTGATSATDATETPIVATRQLPSDKLGKDGDGNDIYVPHKLDSDLIETYSRAVAVATRYMTEFNKDTDEITIRMPLNPNLWPGQTLGVIASQIDLPGEYKYWVRQVSHDIGSQGGFTSARCEGGAGAGGYLIGLRPVAAFTMEVTQETFEVAGVTDTWYTVTTDGSTSYDLDGFIQSWAWSASNGASGTGVKWATRFTTAQWNDTNTPPTITLVVTDGDTDPTGPHTDTLVQTAADTSASPNSGADTEGMFVAAWDIVEATPDSGATWNQFALPAGTHCTALTRLGAGSTFYFGLSNGAIYESTDFLATAATLKYTLPGGVTVGAMYASELAGQANKVAVGDAGGNLYITSDGFATPPTLRHQFPDGNIFWIMGSIENSTQWRVANGNNVWFTNDDFANTSILSTRAHTVQRIELANFANYNSEDTDAGIEIEVLGTPITFPAVSPAPAFAGLAAFLLTDELMVVDDQGRAFVKAPAANTLTQVTNVSADPNHDVIGSRINTKVFYAGTDHGVYKTYDAGLTWYRMRNYTAFAGTGRMGYRLGLPSAPVPPRTLAVYNEIVTGVYVLAGGSRPASTGYTFPRNSWTDPEIERTFQDAIDDVSDSRNAIISYSYPRAGHAAPETELAGFATLGYNDSTWDDGGASGGGWSRERFSHALEVSAPSLPGNPGNPLSIDSYMVFRHKFMVPAGVVGLAMLGLYPRITLGNWYLNGTAVLGAATSRPVETFDPANEVARYWTYVTDLLLPGQENILAGYVISNASAFAGSATGSVAYKLGWNTSAKGLGATGVHGADTLYITHEESRALDLTNPTTGSLAAPPAGWEQPTFNDAGWVHSQGVYRFTASFHPTTDDGNYAPAHFACWIGPSDFNPYQFAMRHLVRQRWWVLGTPRLATLTLRWRGTIQAFFNGHPVYSGGNANKVATGNPNVFTTNLFEQLNIDVTAFIVPDGDNVLAVITERAALTFPQQWSDGTGRIDVAAVLAVR